MFQDPDDLPFKKGDVLTVISKDEEHWWTARNSQGQTGSIPVPYVQRVNLFKFVFYVYVSLVSDINQVFWVFFQYEGPRQQSELRDSVHPTNLPIIGSSSESLTTKKMTLQVQYILKSS